MGWHRLVESALEFRSQFLDKVGAIVSLFEAVSRYSVYSCRSRSLIRQHSTQRVFNPVLPTDEMVQILETVFWVMFGLQSEAVLSQTDSVHTFPGHSSVLLLRPSTGGLPDSLTLRLALYVAFPRSQYYAPSATLRPLQPQVVQSSRDESQRFPRSRGCPLHSGLGCS
jgi:hypothetical protein